MLLAVVAVLLGSTPCYSVQQPLNAPRGFSAPPAFTSSRGELVDVPMEVEGTLPAWLQGTLLRNGPGLFEANGRRLNHLFDGYGMLVRVSIQPGAAPRLSTRFVRSTAYQAAARGSMSTSEFGTPLFEGWANAPRALAQLVFGEPTDNANVNVVPFGDTTVALTETAVGAFEVDLDSLDTKRLAWGGACTGTLATAHPLPDPAGGGGWINVGTSLAAVDGGLASHSVYRIEPASMRREVLATIPSAAPASGRWLHAFGLSRRRVVVIEQPAAYSLPSMLGLGSADYLCLDWAAGSGTLVHVLDRATGDVVTHTVRPAFFFFHVANTFDLEDARGDGGGAAGASRGVSLDLCVYDSPEILDSLRLSRLCAEDFDDLPRSRLARLTIRADGPAGGSAVEPLVPLDDERASGRYSDLPSVAPSAVGDPGYRFAYSIGATRPARVANRLVKTDVRRRGGDASFAPPGFVAGEPLFVPRPGGEAEDDGVLLSLGSDESDGHGAASCVYVLDAADMSLLARIVSPVTLPYGFHGCWLSGDGGERGAQVAE